MDGRVHVHGNRERHAHAREINRWISTTPCEVRKRHSVSFDPRGASFGNHGPSSLHGSATCLTTCCWWQVGSRSCVPTPRLVPTDWTRRVDQGRNFVEPGGTFATTDGLSIVLSSFNASTSRRLAFHPRCDAQILQTSSTVRNARSNPKPSDGSSWLRPGSSMEPCLCSNPSSSKMPPFLDPGSNRIEPKSNPTARKERRRFCRSIGGRKGRGSGRRKNRGWEATKKTHRCIRERDRCVRGKNTGAMRQYERRNEMRVAIRRSHAHQRMCWSMRYCGRKHGWLCFVLVYECVGSRLSGKNC